MNDQGGMEVDVNCENSKCKEELLKVHILFLNVELHEIKITMSCKKCGVGPNETIVGLDGFVK